MMDGQSALRRNAGNHVGSHPWPGKGGVLPGRIHALPISIDPDVLVFFLGDLLGRTLRVLRGVSPDDMDERDVEPGRLTILIDRDDCIVDMWVDPEGEKPTVSDAPRLGVRNSR